MHFRNIKQITSSKYQVNVSWGYLKNALADYEELNMDPDYQRDYVWTLQQKTDYIEYILKGGISGREIYFNHPGWFRDFKGEMTIVDGKQRIQAVLDFLDDKVKAYGFYHSEFEDKLPPMTGPGFIFNINDLQNPKDVYQWYIDLNTGGTSHTSHEIDKVKKLIEKE